MATYYEFKKTLGKLFGCRNIEENEDDIVVCIQNRYYLEQEPNKTDFTISNSELKDLYDRTTSMYNENLEMYTSNSYEIAFDLDYPLIRREIYPIMSNDMTNGVNYILNFPSIEYCAFLLIGISETRNKQLGRLTHPPVRLLDYIRRLNNEEKDISLQNLLPLIIGELSLKIETTEKSSLETFRKYKTSFNFQFMYRFGRAMVEFSNIEDMFNLNRTVRGRIDFEQLDTPPLREYMSDVVDYYKLALSSNDAYIKYISFYHVMEYFYDEVFKKKMINNLRDKITNPGFSYKNDEKLYEMATFIKNRWRMNDESGQGNELESLKFVLNEYVSIDELKDRIYSIDSTAFLYYETNKVAFCNAPVIS